MSPIWKNLKIWILLGLLVVALIVGYILFAVSEPNSKPIVTPSPSPSSKPVVTPALSSEPLIMVYSMVFEGEKWMEIFENGTVKCERYHLYPDYKEIEIKKGYVSTEEVGILLELFLNLTDYNESTVILSDELAKGDHIFDPLGYMKISCLPLNKTLNLNFRPLSFSEPETIMSEAKEILARIDRIYREAEVVERTKEKNPSLTIMLILSKNVLTV